MVKSATSFLHDFWIYNLQQFPNSHVRIQLRASSTLSVFKQVLQSVTVLPAVENNLSDEADLAGMQRYLRATKFFCISTIFCIVHGGTKWKRFVLDKKLIIKFQTMNCSIDTSTGAAVAAFCFG